MTAPRRIVPRSFYMITRRVAQRMFLLRPSDEINAIVEYCLAEAAARFGIRLLAFTSMSNHYHAVVYDPKATLPAFIEHLHKMTAKAVNAHHRRWENMWSTEETCVTRLVSLDDVFDKVVYVLLNPVKAHLVDCATQWPGASSWGLMGRRSKIVKRPRAYFRRNGTMPAEVSLDVVEPSGLVGETAAEWVARVRKAVQLGEEEASSSRRAKGIRLVGRRAVLATNPVDTPKTEAPRRGLRPTLACKDAERMTDERAILKGFLVAYRRMRALLVERLRSGVLRGTPKLEFPHGTWHLRGLGVCCASGTQAA